MFEQEFESMLRQYGDCIDDKKRFTGYMRDLFPGEQRNINLILMAYDLGIAQGIADRDRLDQTFAFRYVKMLVDNYGISRVNADWIVALWCVNYGKNVLHKECDVDFSKDKGPAIKENTSQNSGTTYGDLFKYTTSSDGRGLAVCGFNGNSEHTIIFQNKSGNNKVVEIADRAFTGSNVEEIILTDGYERIGYAAFAVCMRLHQIVMPYSLIEIAGEAFSGCESLRIVTLPERLQIIGKGAFKGTNLRTIRFPDSMGYIEAEAFADCIDLDNIVIPKGVTTISEKVFAGCSSLKSIELPETLARIEDDAFWGCDSLELLVVPDRVSSIGDNAFPVDNKKFILQCSMGTYAESFARSNHIQYQLV